MKNWKTTTFALITVFFGYVLFDPQWFHPIIISLAKYGVAGGFLAFGLSCKDYSNTGTDKL